MIHVLFLADCGPASGLGHLQRCLSLAAALRQLHIRSTFVVSEDDHALRRIAARGFDAQRVRGRQSDGTVDVNRLLEVAKQLECEAIVVDSYRVPPRDLERLRVGGSYVIAVDDLASEPFPCQMVVNSGADAPELPYRSSSGDTRFLLGAAYAMLSPEFWAPACAVVRERVRRVLLTVGGADRRHVTPRLLHQLDQLPEDVGIRVIVGPFFEHREELERVLVRGRRKVEVVDAPDSLHALMLDVDLAVSASGQTLYELACLGCPTVAVSTAPNQEAQLRALAKCGVVSAVDSAEDSTILTAIVEAIRGLLSNHARRVAMSAAGQKLVDGQGALRVAQAIAENFETARDTLSVRTQRGR